MSRDAWRRIRAIFEAACELPANERSAFVEGECAGDEDLRSQVLAMLASDSESGSFLSPPALDSPPDFGRSFESGGRVGAYEIVRRLSSGGMGTVYEAVQRNPRRAVALKVIRFDAVSDSALERFRYEAEVLARMRHPGIAEIHEAGVHRLPDGEIEVPYFAMELLEGARDLVQYSREKDLGIRQRLDLFLGVCDAVHHGHSRGIMHRDLKPSNLLVDRSGTVKVIDFGVARAIDLDVDTTRLTEAGMIVGTLQYMGPEQLTGDSDDLDVRCDVYALGAVLYELLCGSAPHTLDDKSLWEAARIVRDDAPRSPSEHDPRLRGELEWILLAALEKDRERRYATVNEFAADIRRHLAFEPISAGPPSTTYRMRKFVRRHRIPVLAAAVVLAAVLVGGTAAVIGMVEARAAGDLAERRWRRAEAVHTAFTDMISAVNPNLDGRDVRVLDVLERLSRTIEETYPDDPDLRTALRVSTGNAFLDLGMYAESDALLGRALEELESSVETVDLEILECRELLGQSNLYGGRIEQGQAHLAKNLEHSRRVLGEAHPDTWGSRARNALGLVMLGEYSEAESELLEVKELARAAPASRVLVLEPTYFALATLHFKTGRLDLAEEAARRRLELVSEAYGPEDTSTLSAESGLATILVERGSLEPAMELLSDIIERCERRFERGSGYEASAKSVLAACFRELMQHERSLELFEEALAIFSEHLPNASAQVLTTRASIVTQLGVLGRHDEALAILEEVYRDARTMWPDGGLELLEISALFMGLLTLTGEVEEAARWAEGDLEQSRALLGDEHWHTLTLFEALAGIRALQGRRGESIALYRELLGRLGDLEASEPLIIAVREALSTVLVQAGEPEEAIAEAERAMTLARELHFDGNARLASTLDTLAIALRSAELREAALEVALEAHEEFEAALGPDAEHTIGARQAAVSLCRELGREDQLSALLGQESGAHD